MFMIVFIPQLLLSLLSCVCGQMEFSAKECERSSMRQRRRQRHLIIFSVLETWSEQRERRMSRMCCVHLILHSQLCDTGTYNPWSSSIACVDYRLVLQGGPFFLCHVYRCLHLEENCSFLRAIHCCAGDGDLV